MSVPEKFAHWKGVPREEIDPTFANNLGVLM